MSKLYNQVNLDNWKEAVGLQLSDKPFLGDTVDVFYMKAVDKPEDADAPSITLSVWIERVREVPLDLTEDQVKAEIDRLLTSFPLAKQLNDSEGLGLLRMGNQIALQTKRGRGNFLYKKVIFYKGAASVDAPILVANDGSDRYALVVHPDFEKYGFTYEDADESN